MLREYELTWKNEDLCLYHGTDEESALNIIRYGVDLSRCSPLRDFGQGFYTTTHLEQAKSWGVVKATKVRKRGRKSLGCVLELQVSRDWLGELDTLVFCGLLLKLVSRSLCVTVELVMRLIGLRVATTKWSTDLSLNGTKWLLTQS